MLEVCFSDSVKAALKAARHCKAAVGISLCLSQGDIQAPVVLGDCPRKAHIFSLLSFDPYHELLDVEASLDQFWRACVADLEKLQAGPEKARLWVDQTPDAQCGLLFTADLLKNSGTEVHLVTLPARVKGAQCEITYRGWHEVEAKLFSGFLNRERILEPRELESLSNCWQRLKAENAPLRVVENGGVRSVQEDYYDGLIRRAFPETACTAAELIGRALGREGICTGEACDVFIAKRLLRFIESGELAVAGRSDRGFYRTVVRRVK